MTNTKTIIAGTIKKYLLFIFIMAKSRYSKKLVQIILENIEQFGTDKAGFQAAGIGKDTFYQWKRKYPDFSDQISRAKTKFREQNSDTEIGALGLAALKDILANGKKVITKKTISSKTVTKTNSVGQVIYEEVTSAHEVITETIYPPTETLIKLATPPLFFSEAVEMINSLGYHVTDPNQRPADSVETMDNGLPNHLCEQIIAAQIKTDFNEMNEAYANDGSEDI